MKEKEDYSPEETARRMDRALKRSLEMKPTPHKAAKVNPSRVIRAKPATARKRGPSA